MGKNLIQQARGKGGPRYRSPSFNYVGKIEICSTAPGIIKDLVDCPGHEAPLAIIEHSDSKISLIPAPEKICVGDKTNTNNESGSILKLNDIPEGTDIFNIEGEPGDGGKFCRTAGVTAKLLSKVNNYAIVMLPSKKQKAFSLDCRAIMGRVAGSGINEKPILKAGIAWHAAKARNKLWPRTRACAMNAVDHPYGNKRTARKSKQKAVGHFAPPGRKVGKLWPKRTGRQE